MDLFLLILTSLIFVETSALSVRNFNRRNLKRPKSQKRRVFIDTSTLMDGRVLALARTGFLGDEILIPRSVIRELQLLADGSDSEKRNRARFGLDVVNELEREEKASVSIFRDEDAPRIKVDERLIDLAKEHDAFILTNDFNLAKVAATEHVESLNINDLSQSLRSEYLPGDHMTVRIVSVGSNPKQGVAYLSDGTMVVIDDAEQFAGSKTPVEIEFVRYLQTNAGKMMFAKLVKNSEKRKIVKKPSRRLKAKTNVKASGRSQRVKQK